MRFKFEHALLVRTCDVIEIVSFLGYIKSVG